MATSVLRGNSGMSWRPRLLLAAMIAVAALLVAQANPSAWLNHIPDRYIPNALQRVLPGPQQAFLPNAFLYQQQRLLSCEYAATTIAATMGGWEISEYSFDNVVPLNENPHLGFRGNIQGVWGDTTDYGVYPEPLHAALSGWGIPSQVIYAHGDADVLRRELAAGRPVVVWLAMRGAINSFDVQAADGSMHQLTQYMHVMTAYGFDERGVYLTDPGTAVWQFYEWPQFMEMWNVMDGMALSVYSRAISAQGDTIFDFRRYYP